MPFPCSQCQAATINGVPCHETGCPEAWRDYDRDCRECGCPFRPETSDRAVCNDCIADAEAPPLVPFTVWTLDVWGNADDGYEVNDRCKVGTIDLDPDATDADILDALICAGYLKPGSDDHGEIDSDSMPYAMYIHDKSDAMPWLQLERAD